MSEPVSFLGGRVAEGAVTVRDAGLQGMITLRGDLAAQGCHFFSDGAGVGGSGRGSWARGDG